MDATLTNRYLFEEYLALLLLERKLDSFVEIIPYIKEFGVTELPTH